MNKELNETLKELIELSLNIQKLLEFENRKNGNKQLNELGKDQLEKAYYDTLAKILNNFKETFKKDIEENIKENE